jgi:hypothetical protein
MSGRSRHGFLPSPRPLVAVLVSLTVLAGLSIALVVSYALRPRPEPSPPPTTASATLINVDQLAANGLLGQLGNEPFESLRNDVLSQARHALQREPRPGLLPEALGDLRDDGKAALGLAAAFVLGGDARHGRGVVKYLDAWATEATLDPICLETDCGRTWRIARDLPAFVFAADLIRRSPFMTAEEEGRFADWLIAIRPGTTRSDGFQGDAEVLARVVVSAYLDDAAMLDDAVGEWRARLSLLETDGSLSPAAIGDSPIADTQEALTYRLLAARIAEDHGRVALSATGSSGASIRTAVDRLAEGWMDPGSWPGTGRPLAGPLWEIAHALWPDARYVPLLAKYRAGGGGDLVAFRWSTLFEAGVTTAAASTPPVAGGATTAPGTPMPTITPTASPEPTPTPTPTATPRPGPLAQTPTIEFLPGPVRADRARIRLSWPAAKRADDDRSALSYRLDSKVDGGEYRKLAEGSRRRADTTLAPGSEHRFRVRAATEAAGAGPWSAELVVRMRRYEEDHSAIRTSGGWSSASAPAYSDGRVLYSTKRGATMTMEFTGRAVAIRGPIGPTRGEVDVTVDGETVGRIDLGADRFVGSVIVFERAWASDGRHRVGLRVVGTAGRAVVAIDAIDVIDGGG